MQNGIHFFLMMLVRISLHCKLVPVHYREYENGLFCGPTTAMRDQHRRHRQKKCVKFYFSENYRKLSLKASFREIRLYFK